MKEQVTTLCDLYKQFNGDLYITLNQDIDCDANDRVTIGWENLGGDVVYIDKTNENLPVLIESDWGTMDLFQSLDDFISFVTELNSLKENSTVFKSIDELDTHMTNSIPGYKSTDENYMISICNYLEFCAK